MKPAASVREYIAAQPAGARAALRRVRSAIRKALPRAEEAISYGIPTVKLDGRWLLAYAGWKQHYSFYPAGARLVAAFREELRPYEYNRKGTIRFPLGKPVPVRLIERLARFRAKEVAVGLKARAATRAPKRRSPKRSRARGRRSRYD
jgi:uncharacterized protein YdhG (YjbR/CyaY superfamily)